MKRFSTAAAMFLLTLSTAARISAQEGALPKDIFPDSRNRLPLLKPENVSERLKRTYDNAVANFAGAEARGALIRLHASPVANLQMESPTGMDCRKSPSLQPGASTTSPTNGRCMKCRRLPCRSIRP